jgi:hypothetical protein
MIESSAQFIGKYENARGSDERNRLAVQPTEAIYMPNSSWRLAAFQMMSGN